MENKTNEELIAIIERQKKDLTIFRGGTAMLIEASITSTDPMTRLVAKLVAEKFIKELSHM